MPDSTVTITLSLVEHSAKSSEDLLKTAATSEKAAGA